MPRILVPNDDGVHSEGIHALAAALRPLADDLVRRRLPILGYRRGEGTGPTELRLTTRGTRPSGVALALLTIGLAPAQWLGHRRARAGRTVVACG